MPVSKINGFNINWQVVGDRGPWVMATTGGRRGHDEFIPMAQKIARHGFRVMLHDRRNTGASDLWIDGDEGEEAGPRAHVQDPATAVGKLDQVGGEDLRRREIDGVEDIRVRPEAVSEELDVGRRPDTPEDVAPAHPMNQGPRDPRAKRRKRALDYHGTLPMTMCRVGSGLHDEEHR